MSFDPNASPFNAVPRVVVILAAALFGIELVFLAAENGFGQPFIRNEMIVRFGFWSEGLSQMILRGEYPLQDLARFVTYVFVAGNFTQSLFALVFVLALGKYVGEIFEGWAVLAVFFGPAIFGALIFAAFVPQGVLYGAFPGAYGLIGAYTFVLWVGLGAAGHNQIQAFTLIGVLLGVQLIFSVIFGGNSHWVAEAAGFILGFALSTVVSPGGWQRLLRKIRERR